MLDRLSSDDLTYMRAALRARAQADAIWNTVTGIIGPKYHLTPADVVDDETGVITRTPVKFDVADA